MHTLRWILFWFAEILLPAAASLAFVGVREVFIYWSTGHWIPIKDAGVSLFIFWLGFVLFSARGIVLKLQLRKRLHRLPPENRTLEEALSRLRALERSGVWRVPEIK